MVRLILAALLAMTCAAAADDRAAYLALAEKGWLYELRDRRMRRDIPVHINGRDLAGAALCIVGDPPSEDTRAVIAAFGNLAAQVHGKGLPSRYAGPSARACGTGRTVVLRLYSGDPPDAALTRDIARLNEVYGLGLPGGRHYPVLSPGMAQTFFGRRGTGTHIMVQQEGYRPADALARAFYRSILIEELFQAFTFGMDVLQFDRQGGFLSKLQEVPTDLSRLRWGSPEFMRALLQSNPRGLCAFDLFMMHAVARAPVEQTNEAGFLDYIDRAFDDLAQRARASMADPANAPLLAPECGPGPG
ncbi:hypothetical protein [Mameliella sp.]|uniref:hypothetical protein n=1 Tax=Mameliella sp. TaxID=1924940 RepID=UPI003BAC1A28